jgi:RNA polymerase sigma factor (sigma-70 family)
VSRSPADTSRNLSLEEVAAAAPSLQRLARRLLRDEQEALDAVQDTWLSAVEHPPRPDSTVLPWLKQILRNAVGMATRRRRFRELHAGALAEASRPADAPDTQVLLERHEGRRLLVDELGRLPEPYRSTVLMRYFEGLSAARIARLQQVPAGTVRWRLSEGMYLLRRRLADRTDRKRWAGVLAPLAWWSSPVSPSSYLLLGAVMTTKAKLVGFGVLALILVALALLGASWHSSHRDTAASAGSQQRLRTDEVGTAGPAPRTRAAPTQVRTGAPDDLGKQLGEGSMTVPSWAVVAGMPARAIRGRVLATGAPIAKARITIISGMMPFPQRFERSTHSAADGTFSFPPQPATNWILTATASGLRPEIVYVDLREPVPAGSPVPPRLVEIEMQPCSAWARGVVRDDDGQAIAGAEVMVAMTGGVGGHSTRSSPDGRYEICVPRLQRNNPPVIHARADGYGTMELAIPYSESTEFDFELQPQATLSGTVSRQSDGSRVPGAKVSLFPIDDPGTSAPARTVAHRTGREGMSDDAGEFHLGGLAPGRYEVRAEHEHHTSRAFDLRITLRSAEHLPNFRIPVADTSVVKGTLLRAGKPVPWAPVHFSRQDPGTGTWFRAGYTRTLADGSFEARLARMTVTDFLAYPRGEPRVAAVSPRTFPVDSPVHQGLVVELPEAVRK